MARRNRSKRTTVRWASIATIVALFVAIGQWLWPNPLDRFTNGQQTPSMESTATSIFRPSTAQILRKVKTEQTGDTREEYSVSLEDGEVLNGHGKGLRIHNDAYKDVAYLIIGPGNFEFSLNAGIWDKWMNVTPENYDELLIEQYDTLVDKYGIASATAIRCDSTRCTRQVFQ